MGRKCVAFWCNFEVVCVVLEFDCMHRLYVCLSQFGRGEERGQEQDCTVPILWWSDMPPTSCRQLLGETATVEVV
jgi:hypothetical protein